MTSQQQADILLAEHQEARQARLRLSVIRSEQLWNFYRGEISQGTDALTANERMHSHAKYIDGGYEQDLEVLRQVMGRSR